MLAAPRQEGPLTVFWKRKEKAEAPPPTESPQGGQMAALRIYTADATIDGWLELDHRQRLVDLLNVEDLVSVASVPTEPGPDAWSVVDREDMLVVVPPPHATNRAMRPHRVRRRIFARVGDYRIDGIVHLIAGIELDPFLARSGQYFLPVTQAHVAEVAAPDRDEAYETVLINVRTPGRELQLIAD